MAMARLLGSIVRPPPFILLRKPRFVLFIQQGGDFLAGAGDGELQRFVDMNIPLGHALSGMAQERPDREFGEA